MGAESLRCYVQPPLLAFSPHQTDRIMEFTTAALLAASGLAAGLVNAIAGGGTFFTFSALVAAGLPPVVANATSAVAVTPANLSSAWAYRRGLAPHAHPVSGLGVVHLIGGGGWRPPFLPPP